MGFRCLPVCVRNATAGEAQNEKHRDQESLIHYLSATLRMTNMGTIVLVVALTN